jgi:hypothetical protein
MEIDVTPLTEALGKLPWYRDLTDGHRTELLGEVTGLMSRTSQRAEYESLLRHWSGVAHGDAKRSRFRLLHDSGLLRPEAPGDAA